MEHERQRVAEIASLPKPATPELPKWVKPTPGGREMVAAAMACVKRPSDPISDFIARRVAKRENVKGGPVPDPGRPDPTYRKDMYALDRAMSQPGPHDTPMRARLMPWRGRE